MFKSVGVALLCCVLASAIHVDKCKDGVAARGGSNGLGSIQDVRVTDCAESPCKLRKGSEATIEFDFTPDKTYEKLTTQVFGGIGIVRVPFREVHGMDACKDIKRKSDGKKGCPIEPNEVYTYSNSFPILKSYPAVSVSVQYGLNDNKTPVVCFTLPAKISN
ncbi:ecdysteroid-regulated 16 kDa protein [Folsomia candida]|uniref:Ecdysteroid-regulated 16 kDa protein n=1 Tax=Folsomia candida TaxID=158441 RepID=A0A226E658_FOLCA|nr:ecdysteroid-regulated 16 kDa protein [Folsomia candida]OXA52534.1 Ecdysteroid-regulated 16 kDa protein [Folsomia candida]